MVIKPITDRKTASVLKRISHFLELIDAYRESPSDAEEHLREFEPPKISICQNTFLIILTN